MEAGNAAGQPLSRNWEGAPLNEAALDRLTKPDETIDLAARTGFDFRDAYSCLLAPPETLDGAAQPRKGIASDAGFVAIRFTKCLSGE